MTIPFAPLDWLVIALYIGVLFLGGWLFRPRQMEGTHEYFLAGGKVPAWLAAISVLSATQSAATFLGGPDYGFRGDYSYLAGNIGGLIGAVFVAQIMIPRFYAIRATTVYELLETRFSGAAMRWTGAMFLVGRTLAGGARVYLAAIAVAMVMFSDVNAQGIVVAAAAVVFASFAFTFVGGLRSVLLNDLVQFVIYLVAAVSVLVYLWLSIPVSTGALIEGLRNAPGGVDKLRLIDWSVDPAKPFSLLAIVTGIALLYIANSGMDQDTTQRLLSSRDAKTGSRGLYLSLLATVPVIWVFITIGLLLHVVYTRPDLMGGVTLPVETHFQGQKISIFMHYILTELPPGLRGLVTIGVIAAAVATTNSALNALSSVLVQDFYRPWMERVRPRADWHYVIAGRWGMGLAGAAMFGVSILSYYWQRSADIPLLEFALQVMVFAYAGLLGVYFTALFSTRGNTASVVAALITGFAVVLALQPYIAAAIGLPAWLRGLSFPYQLCIGAGLSTLVGLVPQGAGRVGNSVPAEIIA
jgi:solute:Na+ symporter, SSS family